MKAEIVKGRSAFQPVSITFTFETQNELNVLYDVLNWTTQVEKGLHSEVKNLKGTDHHMALYRMWSAITKDNGWPFKH